MNWKTSVDKFPHLTARGLMRSAALVVAGALATSQAQAAFHLWNIRELYTDNSGSLQFIELFCTLGSQNFVSGQTISVTPTGGGLPHTLTIPSNLVGNTANHAFLIGTAGIQAAGAPAPDYFVPSGFLYAGGGSISFFGSGSPVVYSALPTDGVHSRITFGGSGDAVNSPQNFANGSGTITVVPEPATWTLLALSGIGLCLLLRRRVP